LLLKKRSPIEMASGPLSLIMPIAPSPGAVAIAAMVSLSDIEINQSGRAQHRFGSFHDDLLGEGQHIVERIIKDEARGHTPENIGEKDGHDINENSLFGIFHHHLLLNKHRHAH